jgi:hypothetical protein
LLNQNTAKIFIFWSKIYTRSQTIMAKGMRQKPKLMWRICMLQVILGKKNRAILRGVELGEGDTVGNGDIVGVGLTVGIAVGEGDVVGVAVGDGESVGVGLAVIVGDGVGDGVFVGVLVGVAVGEATIVVFRGSDVVITSKSFTLLFVSSSFTRRILPSVGGTSTAVVSTTVAVPIPTKSTRVTPASLYSATELFAANRPLVE